MIDLTADLNDYLSPPPVYKDCACDYGGGGEVAQC